MARLAASGSPWAVEVERWRQDNPGRALTEGHRKVLRRERDREAAGPRPKVTAADEAEVQAIVEAYVATYRRVIADPGFVALSTHYTDAQAILPDARRLADRAKRGDWKPTPAEVVAHRLESYLRDRKSAPTFRLRWVFDRTEQDDLPRPPARAAPPLKAPDGPIGARRGPVLKPTPPPPDVADKLSELTRNK